MKKASALCVSLLLMLCLCTVGADAALADTVATNVSLSGGVVTAFGYERFFVSLENTTSSYVKGDLSALDELLLSIQDALQCTVSLPDGSTAAMCSATWNTRQLSLDVPGSYKVIATLTPPEGCSFGEGVRKQIVLPVQITDEAQPVSIVDIAGWGEYSMAIAVAQGSGIDAVTGSSLFTAYTLNGIACTDENGAEHTADINWDFSALNLNTAGLYTITGTPVAPIGTTFASALVLPQPTAVVSVQAVNKPEIDSLYLLYPDIFLPWVAPQGGTDTVTVWLAQEQDAWQELTATGNAEVKTDEIRLDMNILTHGKGYKVQVDYDGGQTGILSFVWDDTLVINGYWEGDRDGDDGNGNTPPEVIQPPPCSEATPPPSCGNSDSSIDNEAGQGNDPTPPSSSTTPSEPPSVPPSTLPSVPSSAPSSVPPSNKPSSGGKASSAMASVSSKQPTPAQSGNIDISTSGKPDFMEQSSDTFTTISGLRLRLMLQQDSALQFSKQGVSVTLQRDAVAALSLADSDIFYIEILRESDTAFSFKILINDKSVAQLAGTIIMLPYAHGGDATELTVQRDTQDTSIKGIYEAQSGLATFTVDATGRYTIMEPPVPVAADPDAKAAPPILLVILITGCLLTLIGGVWFWIRRAHK